jgi:hypothetical protein
MLVPDRGEPTTNTGLLTLFCIQHSGDRVLEPESNKLAVLLPQHAFYSM